MVQTAVDVMRQPLAVFGVSGVLIGLGMILSDRRRYGSGASVPEQRPQEGPGSEDER